MVDESRIHNTLGKMALYLGNHNSICVSVSGGSDSDIIVHMIATYFREHLEKVHFVFANTGLEYKATLRHLDELEKKYDIQIDRVRGMPIPIAVRKFGVPVGNKHIAEIIMLYQHGGEKATEKVMGTSPYARFNLNENYRALAIASKERGLKISSMCCDKSKKQPIFKYYKSKSCDLSITGERKAEGGQRAVSHTSCFEANTHHGYDKFMPLFFWDDDTKQYYKETEGIVYSDCYEVWGFKRTGCVGCPFSPRVAEELKAAREYEPNLCKACINIFGDSYRIMDEFHVKKKKANPEEADQDDRPQQNP